MLKNLFFKKENKESTGIYEVVHKNLVECTNFSGNESVNDIIKGLGYNLYQIHTIWTWDSKRIKVLGVKIFSMEPVFILLENKDTKINYNIFLRELENIYWDLELNLMVDEINNSIDGLEMEDLTEMEDLSYYYLNTLMDLEKVTNSTYVSNKLGFILYFRDGYLISFRRL